MGNNMACKKPLPAIGKGFCLGDQAQLGVRLDMRAI